MQPSSLGSVSDNSGSCAPSPNTSSDAAEGRGPATRVGPGRTEGFSIRSARPTDLGGVEHLLLAAGLPTAGVNQQFDERYAVAESESGVVIGAEGMETYGTFGLLRSAVVAEAWRGAGVGDALTKDRLAWAATRGLAAVYLLTTTAAEYFRRRGFESVSRTEVPGELLAASEFAAICPSSATVMRLAVGAGASAAAVRMRPGHATDAASVAAVYNEGVRGR